MTIKRRPHILAELAIIFLIAAVAGIAWNHRLIIAAWSGKTVQPRQANVPTAAQGTTPLPLGLAQVKELYDGKEATIVDARDRETFAAGHIKGAISLPLGEADGGLAVFQTRTGAATTIVVYCNGFDCHDSMDLGERLLKAGYRTVYVFLGGYPEWRDAGYPVEGGKQ